MPSKQTEHRFIGFIDYHDEHEVFMKYCEDNNLKAGQTLADWRHEKLVKLGVVKEKK